MLVLPFKKLPPSAVESEESPVDWEQFHSKRPPRPHQAAGRCWGQKGVKKILLFITLDKIPQFWNFERCINLFMRRDYNLLRLWQHWICLIVSLMMKRLAGMYSNISFKKQFLRTHWYNTNFLRTYFIWHWAQGKISKKDDTFAQARPGIWPRGRAQPLWQQLHLVWPWGGGWSW